jgi:hypothetical protein
MYKKACQHSTATCCGGSCNSLAQGKHWWEQPLQLLPISYQGQHWWDPTKRRHNAHQKEL